MLVKGANGQQQHHHYRDFQYDYTSQIIYRPYPFQASMKLIFTRSVGTLQPLKMSGPWFQLTKWISVLQNPLNIIFMPHLKSKYSHSILPIRPRNKAMCPRLLPWQLIAIACSFRLRDWTVLDWPKAWPRWTWLGGRGRGFRHSKSHTGKFGIIIILSSIALCLKTTITVYVHSHVYGERYILRFWRLMVTTNQVHI